MMSKGQQRGNKEAKKPKKAHAPVAPLAARGAPTAIATEAVPVAAAARTKK
jgi:hypothetical protein